MSSSVLEIVCFAIWKHRNKTSDSQKLKKKYNATRTFNKEPCKKVEIVHFFFLIVKKQFYTDIYINSRVAL